MKEYRLYGFADDVIERVVGELSTEKSVLIFPTESSKKRAQKRFQVDWSFEEHLFLTMEELKDLVFLSSFPLLREEKRNLLLYYSVSNELLKEMNVTGYFQFIGIARDFFSLWEEFNEELISPDKDLSLLLEEGEAHEWQIVLYKQMQRMREGYRSTLKARSFDDKIFSYLPENADFSYFQGFKQFLFVNQFYYTKLEELLIDKLDNAGSDIVICYQNANEGTPDSLTLNSENLSAYRTKKITLFQSVNDFAMYRQLFRTLNRDTELQSLIDSKLFQSSYSRFLSPGSFKGFDQESLTNSRLYHLFADLLLLLENLEFEETKKRVLIPLSILQEVFSNRSLVKLCSADENAQESILSSLNRLRQESYRYVDLELRFFSELNRNRYAVLYESLTKLRGLIENLSKLQSVTDFSRTVGDKNWFPEEVLFSETELKQSSIVDVLFETLSNFVFIDSLSILEKITLVSPKRGLEDFTSITGLLRLFLLYLRPKRFRYYYKESERKLEVMSLLDSRNLSFEKIGLLNVNEGILPSGSATPFLFTENQRRQIGLKTYEDIRNWERYYFFRLVLNSREVFIFTQKNEEKDKEVSSFVEELKSVLSGVIEVEVNTDDAGYHQFYQQLLSSDPAYSPATEPYRELSFYTIPYREEDMLRDDKRFEISFSAYNTMRKSPFAYYLRYLMRIEETIDDSPLSAALIGTLSHYLVEKVWKIILSEYSDSDLAEKRDDLGGIATGILKNIRQQHIFSEEFYYKIPHTYSYAYFQKVFLPIIEEGIIAGFSQLIKLYPKLTSLKVFPEIKKKAEHLADIGHPSFDVYLTGRADLRLEALDEGGKKHHSVVDFKSSSLNTARYRNDYKEQLIFYELLYYNEQIASEEIRSSISSYIYSLIDGKYLELAGFDKKSNRQELYAQFKSDFVTALSSIIGSGFTPGEKLAEETFYPQILRKDLLTKHLPEHFRKAKEEKKTTDQ